MAPLFLYLQSRSSWHPTFSTTNPLAVHTEKSLSTEKKTVSSSNHSQTVESVLALNPQTFSEEILSDNELKEILHSLASHVACTESEVVYGGIANQEETDWLDLDQTQNFNYLDHQTFLDAIADTMGNQQQTLVATGSGLHTVEAELLGNASCDTGEQLETPQLGKLNHFSTSFTCTFLDDFQDFLDKKQLLRDFHKIFTRNSRKKSLILHKSSLELHKKLLIKRELKQSELLRRFSKVSATCHFKVTENLKFKSMSHSPVLTKTLD